MAEPEENEPGAPQARHATANGEGRGRTKILGVLVAIMVVAGVVALVMTVFGSNSNKSQAVDQPSVSQVGRASSTAPPSASTSVTAAAPATTTTAPNVAPTTSAPSASTPAKTAPAAPAAKKATSSGSAKSSTKIVKYRVKRGDNLTQIAKWFNQRGYGLVYDWNKSVIGRNPNLIYPGQTIIVSLTGDRMKVSTKNK